MTILNYLRKLMRKGDSKPALTYVQESRGQAQAIVPDPARQSQDWEMEKEIDLSPQTDLENYARGLSVSKKSIERWISSGLLMPEELKVAEKLVKIMSKN